MYTDCNAVLFVQEQCIKTYNVPRLLYHVRHSSNSAFRSLPFRTSLPFNRVRLLNRAQIFNRADSPLLDWKLFTNTFCTLSLTLRNKFNKTCFSAREQHVSEQIGEKHSTKRTKIHSISRGKFSRKITLTYKAAVMKVSRKITTQHCQLTSFVKFSRKNVKVTERNAKTPLCFLCRVGSFSYKWYQLHKSF